MQFNRKIVSQVNKKWQRRVFGRRRVKLDGSEYRIEMRASGIVVRELYARREKTVAFSSIIDLLDGQMRLLQ